MQNIKGEPQNPLEYPGAAISATRHMVGTNLATALALTVSAGLAISLAASVIRARAGGKGSAAGPPQPAAPRLARSRSR